MSRLVKFLIENTGKIVDFLLRKKSFPAILVGSGTTLTVAGVGVGFPSGALTRIKDGVLYKVEFDAGLGAADKAISAVLIVGFVLLLTGTIFGVCDHVAQVRQLRKRRVLVLEHRGLHQSADVPLSKSVPKGMDGQVEELPIDHRQSTATSFISNPADALQEIVGLRGQIRQKRTAAGSGNLSILYGGMAPTPLTFLTGIMIGDEGAVAVLDWDRFEAKWRTIEGEDDGDRFNCIYVDEVGQGSKDVAIAISVSYPSDITSIRETIGNIPLIKLAVSAPSTSAHWSAKKQADLVKAFMDVLATLMGKDIERVHLFIAAPNSVVFNFGKHYDERMHPCVRVYQYEKSASPPFPWSVEMPNHGTEAHLVRSSQPN